MVKAARNSTLKLLIEPLAALAATFLYGHATSEHFRLQVVATVIGLSEEHLRELAEILVESQQC